MSYALPAASTRLPTSRTAKVHNNLPEAVFVVVAVCSLVIPVWLIVACNGACCTHALYCSTSCDASAQVHYPQQSAITLQMHYCIAFCMDQPHSNVYDRLLWKDKNGIALIRQ